MSLKDPIGAEATASIDGARASLEDAAAAAARLLARSTQPLIAGLGADIEGARAAIRLAERVGGVVEHMHSAALLRDLDCLRETGVMLTTPGEARVRADVVLLVGDGLTEAWPHLTERLWPRRPGRKARTSSGASFGWRPGPTRQFLALTAISKLSPLALAQRSPQIWPRCARGLKDGASRKRKFHCPRSTRSRRSVKGARFGVAVWTAASLGALEIEMLHGLVRDLNETTRFSTLPLAAPDNGVGVLAACGWTTGFPMRTGLAREMPIHDPWRFDAERLITSGETDCVLWISAFGATPPAWQSAVNFIALCEPTTQFAEEPNIRIAVGRPASIMTRSCIHQTRGPWSP